MKTHCCKQMELAVASEDNPIEYEPIFREYDVRLIYNTAAVEEIKYCPWCGHKLPMPLRDSFFDLVKSECGIYDGILDIFDNKKLPKEFKSDAWWKKREL